MNYVRAAIREIKLTTSLTELNELLLVSPSHVGVLSAARRRAKQLEAASTKNKLPTATCNCGCGIDFVISPFYKQQLFATRGCANRWRAKQA